MIFARRPRIACLAIAVVALAACTSSLSMDGVTPAVSSGIAMQTGLTIDSITCPEEREINAGDVFEYTAMVAGGGELGVQITQDDDRGNISWSVISTTGLLDLSKVVTAVHDGIMQQLSVDAAIDCGTGQYHAAIAGNTFTCTATTADSESAMVNVAVLDTEGNVNWAIVPQQ